jgi:hypothetical protein
MKKANKERPEKDLQCQAELCGLILLLIVVANSNIERGLCGEKLRITLRFTIRHHYHMK